jgi:Uma2 family endonuclease
MPQKAIEAPTEKEYLEQERSSEVKHDFYRGEIFAMTAASRKHNLIVANLIGELRTQLKNTPCRVYASDMRLKIEETGLFTYPDVMVVCGEERFSDERQDTLLNPEVIVEVLSDSTEGYDRGKKFEHCRKLASLREYVLVSQNSEKMERFLKNESGYWVLTESDDENPRLALESIPCELHHAEVYEKTK